LSAMSTAHAFGRRGTFVAILAIAMLVAAWIVFSLVRFGLLRSRPGVLIVHCDPAQCGGITVRRESVPELLNAPAAASGVRVTPISHGPYTIEAGFSDGKHLWVSYYHLDAGERKRVDVYIDRITGGKVHLKVTGYEDNRLIEEKTVSIAASSGEKPVALSWP
jgi:hypothetical protein